MAGALHMVANVHATTTSSVVAEVGIFLGNRPGTTIRGERTPLFPAGDCSARGGLSRLRS
jgi:hypothetical protein